VEVTREGRVAAVQAEGAQVAVAQVEEGPVEATPRQY
jgi:hypothetical protein